MKHRKLTIYYAIDVGVRPSLVEETVMSELRNLFETLPGYVEMHIDADNGSGMPKGKD